MQVQFAALVLLWLGARAAFVSVQNISHTNAMSAALFSIDSTTYLALGCVMRADRMAALKSQNIHR